MKNKIILFLLAQKGLQVLKSVQDKYLDLIELVIVGSDKNLSDDCHNEIIELCKAKKINYISRLDFNYKESFENTFVLAVGWKWLIKEKYKQILVIHDSLLPKYRGFNPLVTALLNKDKIIGSTLINAEENYDTGDIIIQESFKVSYPISIKKAIELNCEVIKKIVETLFYKISTNNYLEGNPQDHSNATYSIWRDDDDYKIDWNMSSENILHHINCHSSPYLGSSSFVGDIKFRIHKASIYKDISISNRDPGKVIFIIQNSPVIICGKGLLKLDIFNDEGMNHVNKLPFFRVRFK
tara:strand:+ start:129 stop:1016 length:888 start_codon:yes stop_codon:yes gene_type:complete